jgi:hypothetical protein
MPRKLQRKNNKTLLFILSCLNIIHDCDEKCNEKYSDEIE